VAASAAPLGEWVKASENRWPVRGSLLGAWPDEVPESRRAATAVSTTAAPAINATASTHFPLRQIDSRRALIGLSGYLACCPRAEKKLTRAGPAPMTSAAAADIRAADRPRIA